MSVYDVRVPIHVQGSWDVPNAPHEPPVEQDVPEHDLRAVPRARPQGDVLDERRPRAGLESVGAVSLEEVLGRAWRCTEAGAVAEDGLGVVWSLRRRMLCDWATAPER